MRPSHHAFATTDDVTIGFDEWIGGDRGTLLFLHGLGSQGRQFSNDAAFFANEGYHVLVPDLRGHGCSTAPTPLSRATLTVEKLASDLLPMLDRRTGNQVHLVGNSLGGLVGLSLISSSPRKVSSLTTFGTAYKLDLWSGLPALQYWVGKLIGSRRFAGMVARTATQHDHARALLREIYAETDLCLNYLLQQNIHRYNYLETAASFAGHIMIMQGDSDKGINKHLHSTLERFEKSPRFHHRHLQDAGHFANLDQPGKFRSTLLAFLEEVE